MTDARFPDRWLSDRRFQRLSDSHFRSYITALTWAVSNRTDGVIVPEDLELIPQFTKDAVRAFLAADMWEPRGAAGRGWLITDYLTTQTTAAELKSSENARVKDRERKARQRAAKRAASINADVPQDIPRDVAPDNTGQDRQGQDRQGEGDLPKAAGAENWPRWRGPGNDPYYEYN